MTRILFAAGAALLLAACSDENADQAADNAVAVPANDGAAVNAAGTGPAPFGDSSGSTGRPPPVAPDPSDPPPIKPAVQANDQVSPSNEPPPATEDEYLHRNKVGESPPRR